MKGRGVFIKKNNMYEIKKQFARFLRKDATIVENIVWGILRNRKFNNLKFRRQHEINGFIVDFYCHELRLAIEIDGKIHEKQKDYDKLREELIENEGVPFIRVTNEEVMRDINILLEKIKLMKIHPSPYSGRGAGGEGRKLGEKK
jgi:very-short-patch-repair endonuclease